MGPQPPETEAGSQPATPPPGGGNSAAPGPSVTLPGSRRRRFQSRRARLVLALTGGILTMLCLGGVGAFTLLYDEATAIQRTAPDAVVNEFLGAYLRNEDDASASLYQCGSGGDFTQIAAFRNDTRDRETRFSTGISVAWSIVGMEVSGTTGHIDVNVNRTLSSGVGRDGSKWRIAVVDQDGWRVCGAMRTA
ncbi:hypothetical protein [Actinoplanes utahensis]|uniref:hypothetical protein n=1 Tax=Actinoplanes utahensis TaxID=1869 RepID=UPI001F222AB5|nr:hypothetical protein [Actinoplanes utahensis]